MPALAPKVLFSCALLALCMLAVGCGATAKKAEQPSPRELTTRAAAATVAVSNKIQGQTFRGSGFVYDARQGLVVTSTETIWDKGDINVTTSEGRTYHARLAARSPCDDVSVLVLHPRPPGLEAIDIKKGKTAKQGDQITALGFPESLRTKEGGSVSSVRGSVSAAYVSSELQSLLPSFPSVIQHQAPLAQGTSGGPLLDSKGRLVGMNTRVDKGKQGSAKAELNYSVSNEQLKAMISELRPTKTTIYKGWRKRHYCHDLYEKIIRKKRSFTPKGGGKDSHHEHG